MEFFTGAVTKITGVKRNRLQQWIDHGYVLPSVRRAQGRGKSQYNIWSLADVYTIAMFKALAEKGWSRSVVDSFLSQGQLTDDAPLDEINFILFLRRGKKVRSRYIYGDDLEIDFAYQAEEMGMESFEDAYLFNFWGLKRQVDKAIAKVSLT